MTTLEIMQNAREAKKAAVLLTEEKKNQALTAMASALVLDTDIILSENVQDIENAKGKISDVMIDRLTLTESRIKAMASGIIAVAELPDPCGEVLSEYIRKDGLEIRKKSVPMGVVAIIYESRPNVTSDAAALCLKSGKCMEKKNSINPSSSNNFTIIVAIFSFCATSRENRGRRVMQFINVFEASRKRL